MPAKKPTAWARLATGNRLDLFDHRGLGGAFGRHDHALRGLAVRAAAIAIDSAPFTGRVVPSRASSPTTAYCSNSSEASCPLPASMPSAIGRSNDPASLGQLRRGEVDDDAVARADEAAVGQGPLDAVRAFLDGGLRQADENRLGQCAGRDIHLDFDRHGVDADERERMELGEHGGNSAESGYGGILSLPGRSQVTHCPR